MTHADDVTWMERAIELSRKCPPAEGAFSVGAIIVSADGEELATGYSRETDAHVHAEESALAKLPADDPRLAGCHALQHAGTLLGAQVPPPHLHPADPPLPHRPSSDRLARTEPPGS